MEGVLAVAFENNLLLQPTSMVVRTTELNMEIEVVGRRILEIMPVVQVPQRRDKTRNFGADANPKWTNTQSALVRQFPRHMIGHDIRR